MARNPRCTRDEIVLALGLYMRHPPNKTPEKHREYIELSKLLNQLPIRPLSVRNANFRNPSGWDSTVSSKLDKELFAESAIDRKCHAETAQAIYQRI